MDEIIGIQAVRAALRDTPALARTLYLMKGRRDARYNELIGMAREAGIRYQTVEDAWFKRRDFEGAHSRGLRVPAQGRFTSYQSVFRAYFGLRLCLTAS